MRKINNIHVLHSLLIILVLFGLLTASIGISVSDTNDNSAGYEEPSQKSQDEVIFGCENTCRSCRATNNNPFVDVEVEPNPIILNSAGTIDINFTFEEYNGFNLTVRPNSFELITVQNKLIKSFQSISFQNIFVPSGSNATWVYHFQVKPALLLSLKQNGTYKFYLNTSFKGMDDLKNEFRFFKKVPVYLELKVAVIVDKSIYPSLKNKLQRYYDDVNTKIKVEFIECNGTWLKPEALRNSIKTLWQTQNISGALLVGYLPIPMWEIIHSQNNVEKCPIPIFYEDLDGSFIDTDYNSYYDRHYWGANDGPEIWVSFIMPPIKGQTIPKTHLDPRGGLVGGGLTGYYYEDNAMSKYNGSRIDPVIDFDWEDESVLNNIYPDNFSIRWTGKLKVDKNETYCFYTEAKGGVKVWIDGNILINHAFDYPNYLYQNYGSKYLIKGWHDIKVEYYENGQGPNVYGMLRLSWSSPNLKIEAIEKFLDKTHLYYSNKLNPPDNALLFMDYCYGVQCRMKEPIKNRLLDPIYSDNIVVGGCQNNTNASEYIELLKAGYELTSVWSHAGSTYHHIKPLNDSSATTSAPYWKIRKASAGMITFIWGCHAGDIMANGNFETALSNNLVANYAFNTGYGLAAAGCTRSYGTTFREAYYALQNESYLGLGYFYFKDFCYNRSLMVQKYPDTGKDKWIDDEILMGDPFLMVTHRPADLKITIENGKKWVNNTDVTLKLSCTNSGDITNQMSFRASGGSWTAWEQYSPTKSWQLSSGSGSKNVEFRMRNSFGHCFNNAYDVIGIDTEPPVIVSLTLNDGIKVTKNRMLKVELDVIDDLSGPHWVSFSVDGKIWSDYIDYSSVVYYNLTGVGGVTIVYVKVLDGAGNQAQIIKKEIRLDTTEICSNVIISGELGENGWYISPVTVKLYYEVESASFNSIMYRLNGGSWEEYSGLIEINNSGYYDIEYYGTDIYDFKEQINNCSIKLDLRCPSDLTVEINNGKTITNSTEVLVELNAKDDISGCWLMRFSEDSKNWDEWINYSQSLKYKFLKDEFEGDRAIYVQVKDFAGNVLINPAMDDIYIDCKNPLIVSVTPVDEEINVSIETIITIEFNEKLKTEHINEKNIYLIDSDRSFIQGTLDYRSDTFILEFTPTSRLEYYTTYSLFIEPNLQDLAGNFLQDRYVCNFTTIGQVPGYVENQKAKLVEDEIYLTWEPPLDFGSGPILGYKIYKCINSGVLELMHEQSAKELYFIDTQVEINNTYSYSISAYNLIGDGPRCETISIFVPFKILDVIIDTNNGQDEKFDEANFEEDPEVADLENVTTDEPQHQSSKPDNSIINQISVVMGVIALIIILVLTFFAFTRRLKKKPIENTVVSETVTNTELTFNNIQQIQQDQQHQQQSQEFQEFQNQHEQHEYDNEPKEVEFNEYHDYRRARGLNHQN